MGVDNMSENNELKMDDFQSYKIMEQRTDFSLSGCDMQYDFEDPSRFQKLSLTSAQKMYVSELLHNTPSAIATGVLSQAYIAKFPEGLPKTLTALKQGGYGSMVRVEGKFAGSASFYPVQLESAVLGAFTAMSVASGQYFLSQINSQLNVMNTKIDEILQFLYGDKKAELMAEISFAQYAYKNYNSIMPNEFQRIATITNMQEARKIAIKDIEFYLSDLDRATDIDLKLSVDINKAINKALQIKQSLEYAEQLFLMSHILEAYYSGNWNEGYIQHLEEDIMSYVDKRISRTIGCFGKLKGTVQVYKGLPLQKFDKETALKLIDELLEPLQNGEKTKTQEMLKSVLSEPSKEKMYYIKSDGSVYIKKQA